MSSEPVENGVLWVSSYPKSGNTWMRFVLAYLFEGDVKSSVDVDTLIPEAIIGGRHFKLPDDHPVLLKTHWKMDMSLPMMNQTRGFIYLVRNPLDVMLSQFHFNKHRNYDAYSVKSEDEVKALLNIYIKMFIQHKGNPLVGDGGGNTSWVNNVTGWSEQAQQYPHVFVRYEDMIADPVAEIRRVARFLNMKTDNDKIANIAKNTSFKAMKKMEDKEFREHKMGFFYHQNLDSSHKAGGRFMREGKSGKGKLFIGADLLHQFFDTFEEAMSLMGYQINRKTGIVKIIPYQFEEVAPLPGLPEVGRVVVE